METTFKIENTEALTITQAIEHDIIRIMRAEKDLSFKRLKIRDLVNAHHAIINQCEDLQKLLR